MDEKCAEQEISEKENKKRLVGGMEKEVISEGESQDDAFIKAFKEKLTEDSFIAIHENGAKDNQKRKIVTDIDRTSIDTANAIDQIDKSLSLSQTKPLADNRVEHSGESTINLNNGEMSLIKNENKINEVAIAA